MSSDDRHRSILVALDPSDADPSALEHGTRLALRDGAELTVFVAAGLPPRLIWLVPGLPDDPVASLRRDCERRLGAVAGSRPPGVALTMRYCIGAPLATLLDELRDGRHDLVVIGEARRRRWKRALLRSCPTPVLVIAPDPPEPASAATATRPGAGSVAAVSR